MHASRLSLLLSLALPLLLGACATPRQSANGRRRSTTAGCSFFSDRLPMGGKEWCE